MIRHRNRITEPVGGSPTKAGWRVNEWACDVGVSRAFVYQLIRAGTIRSVKVGAARVIVTTPREFLETLAGEAA